MELLIPYTSWSLNNCLEMVTLLPPPSSTFDVSPIMVIYLSFAITLFSHTIFLSLSKQHHLRNKSSTQSWAEDNRQPEVHWHEIPTANPRHPEPLRQADKPLEQFSDSYIDRFGKDASSSAYATNDHPDRCSEMLENLSLIHI